MSSSLNTNCLPQLYLIILYIVVLEETRYIFPISGKGLFYALSKNITHTTASYGPVLWHRPEQEKYQHTQKTRTPPPPPPPKTTTHKQTKNPTPKLTQIIGLLTWFDPGTHSSQASALLSELHPATIEDKSKEGRKGMLYLMTLSAHFIYCYMASDIWLRTIQRDGNSLPQNFRLCFSSYWIRAGTTNRLIGPLWGIDPTVRRIMTGTLYHEAISCAREDKER